MVLKKISHFMSLVLIAISSSVYAETFNFGNVEAFIQKTQSNGGFYAGITFGAVEEENINQFQYKNLPGSKVGRFPETHLIRKKSGGYLLLFDDHDFETGKYIRTDISISSDGELTKIFRHNYNWHDQYYREKIWQNRENTANGAKKATRNLDNEELRLVTTIKNIFDISTEYDLKGLQNNELELLEVLFSDSVSYKEYIWKINGWRINQLKLGYYLIQPISITDEDKINGIIESDINLSIDLSDPLIFHAQQVKNTEKSLKTTKQTKSTEKDGSTRTITEYEFNLNYENTQKIRPLSTNEIIQSILE